MKAHVLALLLLVALVAADALQPIRISQESIQEPQPAQQETADHETEAVTASRTLLEANAAAHHGGHHAAAVNTAMPGPDTDIKPADKQQEAAAAATRGGFGRGGFGHGGNYGPSYWGRRMQAAEQPPAATTTGEQQQQLEAAAAAERGGFGHGGNYGPSYWGRRLQEDAARYASVSNQGRALLAAELLAAEELLSNPSYAAAAAMPERSNGGGRYGPSSHMYEGSRPSRYDFGSMWAGGARRLHNIETAAAAGTQERSGRGGHAGARGFGGGGGRFGPSTYFRGRRLASLDSAMAAEMVHSASRAAPPHLTRLFNGNSKFQTSYDPRYYYWDPRS